MTTYIIPLSYDRPPLTLNQRLHWRAAERVRKELQLEVALRITLADPAIPKLTMPTVTLHWHPKDKRRRDVDNLGPTVKACLDQIVRSGVIADDDTEHVRHGVPVIHPAACDVSPRLWLEVTA